MLGRFAVLRLRRADFSGVDTTMDLIMGWIKKIIRLSLLSLALVAIAYAMLYDVIEAAEKCHTFNVFSNCVENNLRDL